MQVQSRILDETANQAYFLRSVFGFSAKLFATPRRGKSVIVSARVPLCILSELFCLKVAGEEVEKFFKVPSGKIGEQEVEER